MTLEPCNHTGRTGPCAEALVEAGVRRVVFAQADPNPVASRRRGDPAATPASRSRAGCSPTRRGRSTGRGRSPSTTAARSSPGSSPPPSTAAAPPPTAPAAGSPAPSRPPRHPPAAGAVRHDAGRHQHRRGRRPASSPSATRTTSRSPRQPLRVVMGQRDLDPGRRVFDDRAETVHLRTRDPHEALAELYARDRQHVFLEGGPTLAAAFLRRRAGRRGRRLRRADAARRRARRRGRPGHRTDRRRAAPRRSPT